MYNNYTPVTPYYMPPVCHCRWHQEMLNNELYYNQQYEFRNRQHIELKDYGKQPFVVDIEDAAEDNTAFRRALWTGDNLQLKLISLNVGEDIGLEVHRDHDQFLKIEEGDGLVQMGNSRENLTFERHVDDDDAILVPAGTWHNVKNVGRKPLKLYSIYAPPEHSHGTVQQTKR